MTTVFIHGGQVRMKEDNKYGLFTETRTRSLVKAITYRIISITGTSILSWLITNDIEKTIFITVAIQIFLIILYYLWERLWNTINWGRKTGI